MKPNLPLYRTLVSTSLRFFRPTTNHLFTHQHQSAFTSPTVSHAQQPLPLSRALFSAPRHFSDPVFKSNQQHPTSLTIPRIKPGLIPKLKVLDDMVSIVQKMPIDFRKTVVFCVQHHLETTASLYEALLKIGVNRIYSIGKYYSTVQEIEKAMKKIGVRIFESDMPTQPGRFYEEIRKRIETAWLEMLKEIKQQDIDTIIMLDDGGRLLELMPPHVPLKYRITGVEQTQAGLYSKSLNVPGALGIVQVASSALKKMLEPPLIAAAVIHAIQELLTNPAFGPRLQHSFKLNKNTVFGIAGFGAIGKAIAEYLLAQGFYVIVYDTEQKAFSDIGARPIFKKLHKARSIENLIVSTDVIFGCTGKDITSGISKSIFEIVARDVTFISTSSEDKEFQELLALMISKLKSIGAEAVALGDMHFRTEAGGRINLIGASTPVNFIVNSQLNQTNCVPSTDIAITRGALFGAIIQAQLMAKKHSSELALPVAIQLDANIQQTIVESWDATSHNGQYTADLLEKFKTNVQWIKGNSGGKPIEDLQLDLHFAPNKTTNIPTRNSL